MHLTYDQVKYLPNDHPLMLQFLDELRLDDVMHEELSKGPNPLDDEGSYAHFERYIAAAR